MSELEFKLPSKINDDSEPRLVMFGCAAVVIVPAIFVADSVLVVLSNVKLALPAYVEPPSLKIICVLAPCAGNKVPVLNDNPPEPSVIKNAFATPPVIVTLLTGPKSDVPNTVNCSTLLTFNVPFKLALVEDTVNTLAVPPMLTLKLASVST